HRSPRRRRGRGLGARCRRGRGHLLRRLHRGRRGLAIVDRLRQRVLGGSVRGGLCLFLALGFAPGLGAFGGGDFGVAQRHFLAGEQGVEVVVLAVLLRVLVLRGLRGRQIALGGHCVFVLRNRHGLR